mmetsp:Transcript_14203/g.35657  ORF Transcript_14203/g.35657 Transcript_14203/m.35657 type:complete len:619 (+) Transcript_14203:143-1999(+)
MGNETDGGWLGPGAQTFSDKEGLGINFFQFAAFCFNQGTADIMFQAIDPNLECGRSSTACNSRVYVCNDDEVEILERSMDANSMCADIMGSQGICQHSFLVPGLGGNDKYVIENLDGRMHFWLLRCLPQTVETSMQFLFLNKNRSEHLSCEYSPLSSVFLALIWVWLASLFLWCVSWARNKNSQPVLLHKYMSHVPLLKVAAVALTYQYWKRMSEAGSTEAWFQVVTVFFGALFKGGLFSTLLFLAKGWLVVRREMSKIEHRTIILCAAWFTMSTITFELFRGLFLFVWILIHVIILRLIFGSVLLNTTVLASQVAMLEVRGPSVELLFNRERMSMYRRLKAAIVFWVAAQACLALTETFTFKTVYQWLFSAGREATDFILCLVVGFAFRSRVPSLAEGSQSEANPDGLPVANASPHDSDHLLSIVVLHPINDTHCDGSIPYDHLSLCRRVLPLVTEGAAPLGADVEIGACSTDVGSGGANSVIAGSVRMESLREGDILAAEGLIPTSPTRPSAVVIDILPSLGSLRGIEVITPAVGEVLDQVVQPVLWSSFEESRIETEVRMGESNWVIGGQCWTVADADPFNPQEPFESPAATQAMQEWMDSGPRRQEDGPQGPQP